MLVVPFTRLAELALAVPALGSRLSTGIKSLPEQTRASPLDSTSLEARVHSLMFQTLYDIERFPLAL